MENQSIDQMSATPQTPNFKDKAIMLVYVRISQHESFLEYTQKLQLKPTLEIEIAANLQTRIKELHLLLQELKEI